MPNSPIGDRSAQGTIPTWQEVSVVAAAPKTRWGLKLGASGIMVEGYIKVAKLGDLKEGTLFPVIVDDEPVCLAFIEGKVYAFTDNCTHISGPLNEGEFANCVVTCPWHGARFDIRDGKVVRGPARQDLYTYAVKIEDDDVSIYLPPEL